jgi:hypothetical protein
VDDGGAILGQARELAPGTAPVGRGIGALADRVPDPSRRIDAEGEPL